MTGPQLVGTGGAAEVSELQLERDRYRTRQGRRSTLVAFASTVVFAGLAWVGITHAPGWSRVHQSFLDLAIARTSFRPILDGLWLNIRVLLIVEAIVLVLAVVVSGLRTLRGPVFFPIRLLMTIYTDLFRGMPLLIVLYLIGFGLPGLRLSYLPESVSVLGGIALVLTYGAYVSEVMRAGIESVHPSQRAAARALGLSHGQTMRLVVLPQAIRRVLPALLNDFVALQKDVGLISVLGAVDAIRQAQIISYNTFNFTPYVVAGMMFVVLAVPSARVADWVAMRAVRRQQAGGVV